MSTTNTPAPKLTGITSESGECDRCGREIGRVFEVVHPDGMTATYGRRCCAKITGYRFNELERELGAARRMAIITERKALIADSFPGLDPEEAHYTACRDHLWPTLWMAELTAITGETPEAAAEYPPYVEEW